MRRLWAYRISSAKRISREDKKEIRSSLKPESIWYSTWLIEGQCRLALFQFASQAETSVFERGRCFCQILDDHQSCLRHQTSSTKPLQNLIINFRRSIRRIKEH